MISYLSVRFLFYVRIIIMEPALLPMCGIGLLCNILMVAVGYLINLKGTGAEKAFDMINLDKKRFSELSKVMFVRYTCAVLMAVAFYFLTPFSEEIKRTMAIIVLGPVSSVSPAFTGELNGDVELASTIIPCLS